MITILFRKDLRPGLKHKKQYTTCKTNNDVMIVHAVINNVLEKAPQKLYKELVETLDKV